MDIKITQPTTPITLALTLSKHEAMVMRTICRNIGGMMRGPRRVTEEIEAALEEYGVGYYDPNQSGIDGSINFPSEWDALVEGEED